jgi:hypothetical protein
MALTVGCVLALVLLAANIAWATHPEEECVPRPQWESLLTGPPHYERLVLVLQDQMPSQGHRLELFAATGRQGRASYTLLRSRTGETRSCIVSAGVLGDATVDARGLRHQQLLDEADPDRFDIITCHGHYVITRTFTEVEICNRMIELYGTPAPVVSYGNVERDERPMLQRIRR